MVTIFQLLSNKIENKCLCSFLVLFSYISDHLRGQNMEKSPRLFTSSRGGKMAFEGFTIIRTNKILKVVKRTGGNVIFNSVKVE